jgi:hypothetical protein
MRRGEGGRKRERESERERERYMQKHIINANRARSSPSAQAVDSRGPGAQRDGSEVPGGAPLQVCLFPIQKQRAPALEQRNDRCFEGLYVFHEGICIP